MMPPPKEASFPDRVQFVIDRDEETQWTPPPRSALFPVIVDSSTVAVES